MKDLDRQKSRMQVDGRIYLLGLTLRDVCEVVDELGIDFDDVVFMSDCGMTVAQVWTKNKLPEA